MTADLAHSPAHVISKLLIGLGLASEPANPPVAWPAYFSGEPDYPDDCITVTDTQGTDDGSSQIDGELLGMYGFQVRVRSATHKRGWNKAAAIQQALAQAVYDEIVHVLDPDGDADYLVEDCSNIGDVLTIGKDPNSKRSVFTLNAVATIEET